jgi:hypothetical protein
LSFFELVFYVLVLFSIPILTTIVLAFLRGRRRSAWRTLAAYLVLVAVYAAVLIATILATPMRVLVMGEAQFAGDWSIAALSLRHIPHDLDEDYEIDFRLSNRGKKAVNGPNDLVAYLVSEDGTRYDAAPEPNTPPFDAPVQPGKYVMTTRKFVLPTNLNRVELVIVRRGFRLGWFIIGRTPLDGHTVIQLQ